MATRTLFRLQCLVASPSGSRLLHSGTCVKSQVISACGKQTPVALKRVLSSPLSMIVGTRNASTYWNVGSFMDKSITEHYLTLPQPENMVQLMYVWIDGTGETMRAKTRTMETIPKSAKDCPVWSFDGSSTGQAEGKNSDVYLYPVALYNDPFRRGNNKLVLCETFNFEKKPTKTNHRSSCAKIMEQVQKERPWFGLEQEYTLFDVDGIPLGWPKHGTLPPQGPYYCGVGANKVFGRDVLEAHYRACMFAGLNIGGTNIEVMPSQLEYQIGPCEGVEMADQVWMSRFILYRVAEDFGVCATLDPKPMRDWNGAGAHCNFSTAGMRGDGGLELIKSAVEKLRLKHPDHIKAYDPKGGLDNMRRLTGIHETMQLHPRLLVRGGQPRCQHPNHSSDQRGRQGILRRQTTRVQLRSISSVRDTLSHHSAFVIRPCTIYSL